MDAILFPLGFLLVMGLIIILALRRGFQLKKLSEQGVITKGHIVQKGPRSARKGRGAYRLVYEFTDPLGNIRQKAIHVSHEIYEKSAEGGEIEVVYLLQDPGVNAAKYMVDLARRG